LFVLLSLFFLAIALSVLRQFTASAYPFGICLSIFELRILITKLVSLNIS
jgi:hypothetical protein